ncbi:MAG TPA: formylglycine-generating enzyme family protein [Kiritimatiellia bacterium]|jgi:formylglycine-generating enzyme required for sulfatase activity|nr:formylglycine-generating enzyme family protein [Kiritimatiellia bacterium]HPW74743.1 formylglycine-generating enzyme family protein [Kiritimatiellia bacterium]HRU18965.1 formylglycine-generating enzyme family protein [Kiritimatiellia bacterium]
MKFFVSILSIALAAAVSGAAEVTQQIVRQNWPWDNRVRIDYVVKDATGGAHDVNVTVKHGNTSVTTGWYSGELYGVSEGAHTIWWNPMTNLTTYADAFWNDLTVELTLVDASDMYMVIDCTTNASLAVSFTNAPPAGGWNQNLYKTSKLVLRKIPAGTYIMGSPENELGRNTNRYREVQHQVTLTKSFYIGIFPFTQKQYTNLEVPTDYNPSPADPQKPAINRGLEIWRGTNCWDNGVWPHCGEDGFLTRFTSRVTLPAKLTGYVFDLPTIAQWQYACRAGTIGAWNNGTTITNVTEDANLDLLARYKKNPKVGYHMSHPVGCFLPNAFGLYDMHGNVHEMARDKAYGSQFAKWYTNAPAVDPLESGDPWPYVPACGGYWNDPAGECRSANIGSAGGKNLTGSDAAAIRIALVYED